MSLEQIYQYAEHVCIDTKTVNNVTKCEYDKVLLIIEGMNTFGGAFNFDLLSNPFYSICIVEHEHIAAFFIHDDLMKTLSALLSLCEGNSRVTRSQVDSIHRGSVM